jgi:hypothetical protein
MSDEEKRETERRSARAQQGQQHVANTDEAKQARKGSQAPPLKDYDDLSVEDVEKQGSGPLQRRGSGAPRLREATQEPQDPGRVALRKVSSAEPRPL